MDGQYKGSRAAVAAALDGHCISPLLTFSLDIIFTLIQSVGGGGCDAGVYLMDHQGYNHV